MPPAPPTPPTPPPPAPPPRHKSVSFCACDRRDKEPESSDHDARYYSDPGRDVDTPTRKPPTKSDSTDSDLRYYSEPDAKNYFEIDYEFLKELRKIARNNCPKCKRKRSRRSESDKPPKSKRAQRSHRQKESYVFCKGRYHSDQQHCRECCRVCSTPREPPTPPDDDDQYSLVARSYSRPSQPPAPRSTSTPTPSPGRPSERNDSIQSIKSVSFLESSNDESKDETNYTAKSFTNDLKRFLLKPSAPRQSLRDKFMSSIKEFEVKKKSPKLRAIKGLWKSY